MIQARGLNKAFGRRPGLIDVSLAVEAGSFVLVTGANGAGKSTLLRCLAGVASCQGEVRIAGRPVRDPHARQGLAYLPQHVELPSSLSVAEVLELFRTLRGQSTAADPTPTGFVPPGGAVVGTLSGGQRRRLAITSALLGADPSSALLLDEPDASLDEEGKLGLRDTLVALRDGGATVLLAGPSATDLGTLAGRIVVLDDGRIAEDVMVDRTGATVPREASR